MQNRQKQQQWPYQQKELHKSYRYRITADEGELNIIFDTVSDVRFYFGLLVGTLFMLVIS